MLRAFTDSTGVEWRVWDVLPGPGQPNTSSEALSGSLKNTAFAHGWLCFESASEKRRLAPIPSGWELEERQSLEAMRELATPVPLRPRGRVTAR